ncbi:hypothetical protein MLD38_019912 [Melastoma candidum]|uniref:Uncharacterized protein n=1 Tax=Melastoma candidum TaxID=119954 RepID=A0ACB9QB15_9MYRT|nr:hypothetical protein MLD38_019912 [Melastoma candidum]
MANETKYECLLFDMDDTLYPLSSGLNLACRRKIQEFMLHELKIDESEVPRMCLELYREHGTTMAGLKVLGYEFNDDQFHAYVHGRLPYETLKPDPVLRNLLLSMPQRKIIFTNADQDHAAQVLTRLGLEDCFEGVICFETLNPPQEQSSVAETAEEESVPRRILGKPAVEAFETLNPPQEQSTIVETAEESVPRRILCKPAVEAFEAAIRIANVDPSKTIFFDDSARNIASGKVAGLHTVIVGSSELVPGADHALSSIHNIKEAIPEIWEGQEGGEQVEQQIIQSTAVQTAVLA